MRLYKKTLIASAILFVSACQSVNFSEFSKNRIKEAGKQLEVATKSLNLTPKLSLTPRVAVPLESMIGKAVADVDVDAGFRNAIKSAVLSDPVVVASQQDLLSQTAAIDVSRSLKKYQLSGTVYGGVEDITDETAGIAVVLSANKMIFDGGQLDNQISAQEFISKSASFKLETRKNERAFEAALAWVELDRYVALNRLIGERLEILGPLITQLERVAEAGIGDVSQVAAAQRTVSLIRVTQTDVGERLEQAKLNFIDIFGRLPEEIEYDTAAISTAVPKTITDELIFGSSALRAEYANYQAALASLKSVQARDNYSVGFEGKLQRPIGGSGVDSDESVGLVVQRTLYNGNKLSSEIAQAEAKLESQVEIVKAAFRLGKKAVETSQQTISSMDKAIALAIENAENSSNEIDYLRKQLIIGQSTLDSVLSAEARLYDAQSKEINFVTERKKAELTLLSTFSLLTKFFNLD